MNSSIVALTLAIALSSTLLVSTMPHSPQPPWARPHMRLARRQPLFPSPFVHNEPVSLTRRAARHSKSDVKQDDASEDEDDDEEDCEDTSDDDEEASDEENEPADPVDETRYTQDVGKLTNPIPPQPNSSSLSPKHKASETSKGKHQPPKVLSGVPIKPSGDPSESAKYKPISHPDPNSDSTPSSYTGHGGGKDDSHSEDAADSYHGKATFYTQDGNPGACGKTHSDSDYVVAIQSSIYDSGKFCGKTVLVTRKSTGQSIKCEAADACPGCPTAHSLDLSVAAFNVLGHPDEGIFDIDWKVVD